MTREEATEIIRDYDVNGCGYCHQGGNEIEEAFDMAIEALSAEPCENCISRAEAIKALEYNLSIEADGGLDKYRTVIKDLLNAIYNTQKKAIEDLPSVQPKSKWIPIKTRPLTNKEKEECADLGFSEDSINFMYDCPLPEDGEEVLITTRYDEVRTDTFYRDDGFYFETYCDEDDVKAWQLLPEPYKAESEDKE